ncbi:LacI family transcriptional regulator [Variovorax sp. WS11]|uniref:LacI family DNA-binding transcriptional regulator n=1 Tax=Variovorax sp. WS11 TaxID=1105204 RepID=UPI000D0E1C5A|nr:LacI family DNA-binding transcriptional regulator [Variovorax sp. WS11]NDZ18717.1 LacI family transcriptional regulator [Variovorax sp. WS11]PSL79280.1 LacI family transcriptional regulator [Variovorax sp. WS11]
MAATRRLTQQDIAKLAGVSQATVSLVLNGAASALARIPAETRERVQTIIRNTGYVPDPIARRMAKGSNRILGVFTYEPAFPNAHADFFLPFLFGIEEEAQARGYDLLLLTGAGEGAQRKIFAEEGRLRIADGCIVLGKTFDRAELAQLMAGDYPFVAIGRREDAGGPVPFVGGDYATATGALVQQARALGHRRLAYLGPIGPAESTSDRWQGFTAALGSDLQLVLKLQDTMAADDDLLDALLASRATAAFCVELADAVRLERAAKARGLALPADLSLVALGSHIRTEGSGTRFASFSIPREEMGRQATAMLVRRVEGGIAQAVEQVLLPCEPIGGETLGPAKVH